MIASKTEKRKKPSKLEGIKENSHYLREPLASELLKDTTHFSQEGYQILKFHGSYQQDNRDNRQKGQEKDYQFMLRTRSPAGYIPPQLYLTLDQLSEEYGNQTLRVTTRQGFQLHGVLKKNLKETISRIIRNMGSTLGACGDLNRNVMSPPAPFKNRPEYQYAWQYANNIADLLRPQSEAYYEIWLDGEKFLSAEEAPEVKEARERNAHSTIFPDQEEPIYGKHYMPRKFKCCVTVPEDNSIDVYTHDVSLVVITDDQGELQGFNVLAGGGMGRTHNKEETFARMADPLCYVDKEDVYDLLKAIVATQRDYGDRVKRIHARMKYLLHDWGVDQFRAKVEQYFGKPLQPYQSLPEFQYEDYLGWHEQGDGKLFFGLSIENGRIKDQGSFQLKSALRKIIKQYQLPIRLTANHDLLLYDINPEYQSHIEQILTDNGVVTDPNDLEQLERYAMACPALPTCGLAITESERSLPGVLDRIRGIMRKLHMPDQQIVIRMTGCPNGCSRPYMAELGFVGQTPGKYQVWLGGTPNQTALAQPYMEQLSTEELEKHIEPILAFYKEKGKKQESFGEFCNRVGFDAIGDYAATYQPGQVKQKKSSGGKRRRHRISIYEDLHQRLKTAAEKRGTSMTKLVSEALENYLDE